MDLPVPGVDYGERRKVNGTIYPEVLHATVPLIRSMRLFAARNTGLWFICAITSVVFVTMACDSTGGISLEAGATDGQDSTTTTGAVLLTDGDAPAFEVASPTGGVFNLDRLEGQPVLLNFWFPSCPPCRAELPDLQDAYQRHGEEIQFLGVQLLGLDSAEEGQQFLNEFGITYPSGPDVENQMIRDFKVLGFPTTIFIDRNHNVVKKYAGILSEDSIESFIASTINQ